MWNRYTVASLLSIGSMALAAPPALAQDGASTYTRAPRSGAAPGLLAQAGSGAAGQPANARNYPARPIHMVTAEPGGGADFAARLIAQNLAASLGQQIVIENQGGASGVIAARAVARAPADGYTLLFFGNNMWIVPFMQENAQYDPVRDFMPITSPVMSPCVVVVHPSLPVRSIKELVALAKAKPGQLNYSSGATGAVTHLAVELFKARAGANIVRITYKGTAQALTGLLSGETQLMFPSTASVTAHVQSGRLRALAVTSAQPSALFPGVPTMIAAGLPGYEANSMFGIFAPAKTPEAIISRLHQEVVQVLKRDDVKEKFLRAGQEIVGSSPEEFAATMKADMATMGKLIRDFNIRAE